MSLLRRIQTLEAAHSQAPRPCSTCGDYDAGRHKGVVITHHERPLEHCVECGAALTDEGTPLPTSYKRIILSHGTPEDVP